MAPRIGTLLLVVALAVAACGDDDDGDAGPTSTSAVTTVDARPGDDGTDDDEAAADTTTSTSSTTTTSAPEAGAEDPPLTGGEGAEGGVDDFVYVADLDGAGGAGRAELQPGGPGELCVDMEVTGLSSAVTDAHVHESQDGGAVLAIGGPTRTDGGTATWDGVCVPVDAAVADALAVEATGFHVDVHTATHPDGAVRGQLGFATIFDLELS